MTDKSGVGPFSIGCGVCGQRTISTSQYAHVCDTDAPTLRTANARLQEQAGELELRIEDFGLVTAEEITKGDVRKMYDAQQEQIVSLEAALADEKARLACTHTDRILELEAALKSAEAEINSACQALHEQENENEKLEEALRKLSNEAAGFLSLSDIARHGTTNSRILRDRIEQARDLLSLKDANHEG